MTASDVHDPTAHEEPSAPTVDLERLRVVYRRLMAGYADALGKAERIARSDPSESANWYLFPPLVRLLTGGHVRVKLRGVAARCAQLGPALDPEQDGALRRRLSEMREEAERTAASLPSLRVPSVFVLVPFLLGLAPPGGKALDLGVPTTAWLVLGAVVLILAIVAFRDLHDAFRRKRELLLPGAGAVDHEPPEAQRERTYRNAYADEDELFALLRSGKRQEAELDRIVFVLVMLFLTQGAYLTGILFGRSSDTAAWVAAGFAAAFSIVFLVVSKRAPRRIWR